MVKTFAEFWEKIKEIKVENDEMLFFRGVGDASYDYLPGCCFENKIKENEAYHNIILEYPEEFGKREHLSNLSKMQHYGLPTRLLDLTTNPLISLFFAAEQDKGGKDGVVNVLKVKKKDVLHHNSDKALMLACLPPFSDEDKAEMKVFCEKHKGIITEQDIQFNDVMKRFLHEIRGEYPAFEMAIVGQDLLNCFIVMTNKDNERIKIQDGAFVIYGLDIKANAKFVNDLEIDRIMIDYSAKKDILKELEILGLNSKTVYPGLERTSLYLRCKKLGWKDVWE